MTDKPDPRFLTVKQCLARFPIRISERSFRQLIRKTGAYHEWRRQLFLTEADFQVVLEHMRPRRPTPRPRMRRLSIDPTAEVLALIQKKKDERKRAKAN
jgi:hypothetical protein